MILNVQKPNPTTHPGLLSNDPIPWDQLLPGCFYYPCCFRDSWPLATFSAPGRLFVYVDYLDGAGSDEARKEGIRSWLEGLPGFRGIREVTPQELGWKDWTMVTQTWERPEFLRFRHAMPKTVSPFAFLAGIGESWILFLATEAVATYEALFLTNGTRPDWVALIQPGFGLGGGWCDFRDEGNPWDQTLHRHPQGVPPHLVTNRYCHRYPAWESQGLMHRVHRWDRDSELTLWSLDPAAASVGLTLRKPPLGVK